MMHILELLLSVLLSLIFIALIAFTVSTVRSKAEPAAKCRRIIKYLCIALLISVIAYLISMTVPVLKDISSQNSSGELSDKTFLLCILVIAGVLAGAILFILMPVLIVRAVQRGFGRISKEQMESAVKLQHEHNQIKAEEMDVWKKKHKRTRCPYCGTYNFTMEKHCSSCGAVIRALTAADEQY